MMNLFSFSLITALLYLSPSVNSDFFDLCQPVQEYQVAYTGRCTINQESFSNALNETIQFIIENDPELTINEFLKNQFFVGSAEYFKKFYFPEYQTQFDRLVTELLNIADKVKNSVNDVSVEYLFTAHRRSGFDKVFEKIEQTIKEEKINASNLFFQGNITEDQLQMIKSNKSCNTGSFCNDIESTFGLENIDQFKKLSLGLFLKEINEKTFKKFASSQYFNNKISIDKFIENLEKNGTEGVKTYELIQILNTDYVNEIVYSFAPDYSTKRPTRTSTIKKTTIKTTKKPKIDTNLVAVKSSILVSIPLVLLALGLICSIIAMYFWYNFIPVRSHNMPKISDFESKLPSNIYEMNIKDSYVNNMNNNHKNAININNILHSKF